MSAFGTRIAALAAAFVLAGSISAQAVTVTFLGSSTQGPGNTADVYAPNFNGTVPDGATFSSDPLVTPPPGNLASVYQSPFNNTPLLGTQTYFSVGAEDGDGDGALSPVTLTYTTDQSTFTILWGSIDSYNTIEFLDSGGTAIAGGTFTGTDIISLGGLGGAPANFEQVALIKFDFDSNELFRSIRFTSTQAAFEFALPSEVPAPGAAWLLLGGMLALGAALRRRNSQA
ncbi:MAG: VPLPA-CTERM sorting domain-containing protein [Alphaproteobacteria bacterium]|nr:VPLPA-CTERM sorting domain-containing protein [Alphaproteobacteria bacterium]